MNEEIRLTPLQKKLYRAKVLRRGFFSYMEYETGIPVAGYKRLYSGMLKEIISGMTDNQIRDFLYSALDASDITAEEKAEAEKILGLG